MAGTFLPLLTDVEKASIGERQPLPDRYLGLSDEELDRRIAAAKAALGSRLLILGHHYQRDEVIRFADITGDSYRLSQHCAAHPEAEFIVFCGVHFMAESADVLSAPHQQVVLPDLAAGCSMADMAAIDQLETCWAELAEMGIGDVVPVTYINSSAAIKAFVGEQGGVVCTSSNAAATLRWAWARGKRILFLPDQHLGRRAGAPVRRHHAEPGQLALGDYYCLPVSQKPPLRYCAGPTATTARSRYGPRVAEKATPRNPTASVILRP